MRELAYWLNDTSIAAWVNSSPYIWPTLETLHFMGLCLLMGALLVIDLRLIGVYTGLKERTAQRLVQLSLLGFAINLVTGILFLAANTWKYFNNGAFEIKMVLILLAGINALFYEWKEETLLAGGDVTRASQAIGLVSILLWSGIIVCGRMITFFAPATLY